MDELIAFLRARWDEEEADARSAAEVYGARWWWNPAFGLVKGDPDSDPEATSIFSLGEETVAEVWSEVGPHIARHDPARVLADIDAKRRVLAMHGDDAGDCSTCGRSSYEENPGAHLREEPEMIDVWRPASWPCATLRLLALPYIDRPDCRPEWKP